MAGTYSIHLRPGFSMIAFPVVPVHKALDAVFPLEVKIVLGYRNDEWQTSMRGPADGNEEAIDAQDELEFLAQLDGEWEGTLPEVEAGYGYWVMAAADCTIEVEVALHPATPPSLVDGWNMIGVVDSNCGVAGDYTAALLTMDDYLGEGWAIAYTTEEAHWSEPPDELFTEVRPLGGHLLKCGKAYWVFVGDAEPGDPPRLDWLWDVGDADSRAGRVA